MGAVRRFGGWVREAGRLGALAVRLTWRASPRLLLAILLLVALQAALPLLELALAKAVLDRAALDLGLARGRAGIAARLPLGAWIALAAAVLALGQLLGPLSRTAQSIAGDQLIGAFRAQTIRAANAWRGLARFEDPAFADDLRRVRDDGAWAGLKLLTNGAEAVLALLTAATLALTLAGLHPLAPVLLVLAGFPLMAMQWSFTQKTRSHLYWKTPGARRMEYSRDVLLTPETAKDVRLYGLGRFFAGQYARVFAETSADLYRLRLRLAVRVALAGLLSGAAAGGAVAYTVWRIAGGVLTPGDLLLYGGAATLLQGQLNQLGSRAAWLPQAFGLYLPSLDRVINAPPDLPLPARALPAPRPIRRGIRFEDVRFTYPGAREPVLRGVSFALCPGESLALVGRNGAGKTTLVKLLLRLYDPDAGRITLDGEDLREYDLDDLRREMGAVFQDFVRYELSARENIGLSRWTL